VMNENVSAHVSPPWLTCASPKDPSRSPLVHVSLTLIWGLSLTWPAPDANFAPQIVAGRPREPERRLDLTKRRVTVLFPNALLLILASGESRQ
jgi:hypothetical protein